MSTDFVLPSTFFLTVLIVIGLFFFIRASAKPRLETATWTLLQTEQQAAESVTRYLEDRGFKLNQIDRDQNQVVFSGLVRASVGLAIFLSVLAAVGALCFGLVLSIQFPQIGYWGGLALFLAPLAGLFYWRKSERIEQVSLSVKGQEVPPSTRLRITAHRDEIAALSEALHFPPAED